MYSSHRLTKIPSFLITAAKDLANTEKEQRIASFSAKQAKSIKSGKINRRWAAKNMSMINHGFGVLEDKRTGSVWYVEDDNLIRQNSDEDIETIIASL